MAERAWSAGARLSLTTLTVLPVRGPATVDRRAAGVAMAGAPLVGLLLGLVAGGVLEGARAVTDGGELLGAALAVAVLAALTRGLHLDGLADTVDGLASYLPPEQARAVMKKPDVGPLGLAAVVLSLLVQTAALVACLAAGRGLLALVVAAVTARVAVTLACTPATPAASPGGLGAAVAGTVPRTVAFALAVLVAGAGAAAAALTGHPPLQPVLAVFAGLGAAALLRAHAVRRLGGITGDVLGALIEATTTVVLIGIALGGHAG
jgi:adenosylcobinamide-GDP ribazoletransferase